jgi:hypothetical protein
MSRSRHAEGEMIAALKQAEAGVRVGPRCFRHGTLWPRPGRVGSIQGPLGREKVMDHVLSELG